MKHKGLIWGIVVIIAASVMLLVTFAYGGSIKQRGLVRKQSISRTESSKSHKAKEQKINSDNVIYLTFDDGPDDATTPQLLNILKKEKVKATFFVTGYGSDDLIKREYDEGHQIGLHTMTHNYAKVYASEDAYFDDLQQISDRVFNITGKRSTLVRVPGGSSNTISNSYSPGIMAQVLPQLIQRGYQYFDWNVSAGDGATQNSPDQPYNNITANLKQHTDNVVLMHDTKQNSVDAVHRIIEFAKQNGYVFKKLNHDSWPSHQVEP